MACALMTTWRVSNDRETMVVVELGVRMLISLGEPELECTSRGNAAGDSSSKSFGWMR